MAYARGNHNIHPSLGLFNILDPASVLCFARFILGLQPYFSSTKRDSQRLDTKDFCWRLDHTDYDHQLPADVPLSSSTDLEAWVGGLSHAEIPE